MDHWDSNSPLKNAKNRPNNQFIKNNLEHYIASKESTKKTHQTKNKWKKPTENTDNYKDHKRLSKSHKKILQNHTDKKWHWANATL